MRLIEINAGDLRTPVRVLKPTKTKNAAGFTETVMIDVLGFDLYCQWANAHGSEVLQLQQLGLTAKARLRCRYQSAISPTCIVRRGLTEDWDVISVDDIENRHQWMEISIVRRVDAI